MKQYSVDEISISNFPNERVNEPAKIYLLLLSYVRHRFQYNFVNIYGTDFTVNSCVQTSRFYTHHCELNDGSYLPQNKVIKYELGDSYAQQFFNTNNLPPPGLEPNDEVYSKKILVEINGFLKRYKNEVDFCKGSIRTLTKSDVIKKVRVSKDQHLIRFLTNLQNNCPSNWKFDLYEKYGLNELVDDIGVFGSQTNEFITQRPIATQSQVEFDNNNNQGNVRLLNDMPIGDNDLSNYPETIQQLSRQILKQEKNTTENNADQSESIIIDNSSVPKHISEDNANQTVSIVESNYTNQTASSQSATANQDYNVSDSIVEPPNNFIPETQTAISNGISSLETVSQSDVIQSEEFLATGSQIQQDSTKTFSANTHEMYCCGYSFGEDDVFLVRNINTGEYEILDTFELYLKMNRSEEKIYTLSFKSSDDVNKFIFKSDKPIPLTPDEFPEKEIFDGHFIRNIVLVNDDAFTRFSRGELDVCYQVS